MAINPIEAFKERPTSILSHQRSNRSINSRDSRQKIKIKGLSEQAKKILRQKKK